MLRMQLLVLATLVASARCEVTVRYFAYGSNMATSVLTGRRRITPLETRGGVVRDHRLGFTLPGFGLEPAFASCDRAEGERLHGVCYTLSLTSWLRICATEGVPAAYRVITVPVECYDGLVRDAYTLQASVPFPFSLPPSRRYLRLLQDGAREAELDPEWQVRPQ